MDKTVDDNIQLNAEESLREIEKTIIKTHKAIAASYSPIMIFWGILLTIAYITAHFYIKYAGIIFWTMAIAGTAGGFLLWFAIIRKAPFKEPVKEKMNLRIGALWWLLFLFIFIWLNLLSPLRGIQVNAFIITVIMFGYVIEGLWFRSYFMVWLGLLVTAATMAGFYLIPQYYCIWMAFMCGAAIFGTGLYMKLRWS